MLLATVAMAATRVTFLPSAYVSKGSRPFEVNVVRVWETTPPPGENPIEWVLLTTETVDGDLALQRIVDIYRRRWVIEDFFKALKTGCSLEKRQIESEVRRIAAELARFPEAVGAAFTLPLNTVSEPIRAMAGAQSA
jgi:hypothetical protein